MTFSTPMSILSHLEPLGDCDLCADANTIREIYSKAEQESPQQNQPLEPTCFRGG